MLQGGRLVVFEREIELEKGESSAIPFLIITVLVFAVASAVIYFVLAPRKVLSVPEATQLVTDVLNAQGTTTVRFHTGLVKERRDESPRDSRYRLLEEAGVLKIGTPAGSRTPIALTERGSAILSEIPGVKRSKEADGTVAYVVPLADRQLVDVANVSMDGPDRATIEYTWQWQPNALGKSFDRLGPAIALMRAEDQLELVNRFGARYYHEVPKREVIRTIKSPQGWRVVPQ